MPCKQNTNFEIRNPFLSFFKGFTSANNLEYNSGFCFYLVVIAHLNLFGLLAITHVLYSVSIKSSVIDLFLVLASHQRYTTYILKKGRIISKPYI